MADSENEEDNGLNIARRTRSHLKNYDFVPNDNLDFPDVDMNLYQNPDSEGDPEYRNFLNQCYSAEIGTSDTNQDDNDPEFIYNDHVLSPGWSYDLNEVYKLNREDTVEYQRVPTDIINEDGQSRPRNISDGDSPPPSLKSPLKARRKIDMFADPEFARILNQQLRQHIQLLTQTFLLTKNTTNMRDEAEEAKGHLLSYMKIYKNKSKPSNLLPALELVENLPALKDLRSSIRLSWRPLQIPESVRQIINNNPNIFIYPSLLPQVAFSILPEKLMAKKPKINFTTNEDKLLAYALNEFKGETSQYAFIASLLMTAKTKTQISNHIKNIKRSPGNENNPIKLYYTNGELPEIDLDSDSYLVKVNQVRRESSPLAITNESEEKLIETTHLQEQSHLQNQSHVQEQSHVETNLKEQKEKQNDSDEGEVEDEEEEQKQVEMSNFIDTQYFYQEQEDIMNMDLDDLMAASSTISKSTPLTGNNSENNKNIKNLKLKKSMLNLMSHNFLLSKDMGDLIIHEFLKATQEKLSERNNLHLLQLLASLMKSETRVVTIYQEISKFLEKIKAPKEIHERIVLFLDLNQATQCGCSLSYLHWMRFFEFMQHVELYHDGVEAFEKKLTRLVDALQKDDSHKVKLAIANLVNKHPFLKREFESLSLDEKPHPSLFICEEDFDDITEPINLHNNSIENSDSSIYKFEHFQSKLSEDELNFASQACPCKCHSCQIIDPGQPSQHCNKCNLKFMKGRMYLVNKIKPILAEWSYTDPTKTFVDQVQKGSTCSQNPNQNTQPQTNLSQSYYPSQPSPSVQSPVSTNGVSFVTQTKWTLEEDREILEFCRSKAEQNEETISFDTSTFEELVSNRGKVEGSGASNSKKSAREIAERFNQLMEMYKDEASSGVQ